MHDTTNSLVDFDICVALAQQAIDSQMTYAWKTWKRRTNFSDTLRIFKRRNRDGSAWVDSKQGLEVTLAPLKISLAVEDGRQGQVRVTMPLTKGRVTYYDEDSEGLAHHDFTDWSISFLTDLDKKPIDLKALEMLDPGSHASAQDVISQSGLPESVFSIEYLFLKLTSVDLLLSDNKNIAIPADVPSEARARTLQMLTLLLQGDMGDYMLGTVVRRNTRQATPTFALTDFIFNVRPNWEAAKASTLEYLGALGGRPMPPDLNSARLKLDDQWFGMEEIDGTNSSVSGVMVLSRDILMDHYLIPAFSKALGVHPTREGLVWTFAANDAHTTETHILAGRQTVVVEDGYNIALRIKPGENGIALSGVATGRFAYDGYNPLVPDTHIEWLHVSGARELSGNISLATTGTGADFKIETDVTHSFAEYVETEHDKSFLMIVYDALSALGKIFDNNSKSIDEAIASLTKDAVSSISNALNSSLDDVTIALKQQGYIPPGGGVFTFQNPRFTSAGDLMMDVIYIAP